MLPDVAVCRTGLYLWWRLTLPLGLRGRPSCCRVWRASGSELFRGMTCHIAIFCHIICPPKGAMRRFLHAGGPMHGFLLQVGWSCISEAYDVGGLAARTCLVQHGAEVRNSVRKPSRVGLGADGANEG